MGAPSPSPKGATAVWDDDHLVFADIRLPRTLANLRANPMREVNVVDPVVGKGSRFKGSATIVNPIGAVVLVRVERAWPLGSPAYDLGASEDDVRRRWRAYWASLEREPARPPAGE